MGKPFAEAKANSIKHKAYHVVSTFTTENQLVLGELVTQEKSNEVTAVPELLNTLQIAGSIVTADAMSCQKAIAGQIQKGKADYVIGLKGNQPALLENVSLYCLYWKEFSEELPSLITKEKDHGRMETREYRFLSDVSWLEERKEWAGLNGIGSVQTTVTKNDITRTGLRFFITSLRDIERFSYAVCHHWAIENQLHWAIDVIFDEDGSKVRKDMSPLNLNVLRKTALALCKHTDFERRVSLQKKRFAAALNPERFLSILFAKS